MSGYRGYASQTSVSVTKSVEEIRHVLDRYGATGFMYGTDATRAMLAFQANNKLIRFVLPLPKRDDEAMWKTPTGRRRKAPVADAAWEQETKRRWRALGLSIKGKLEAVNSGISEFEEEFLAHIVMPNDQTVGQYMLPKIEKALETHAMPKLLPMLEEAPR